MIRRRGARIGLVALAAAALPAGAGAEPEPFAVQEIPAAGRVIQGELADLDGDGRADLWCVAAEGMPPHETRELRVHFQREAGALPAKPDWRGPLPDGAVAYDLAELDREPGAEILLLGRSGLTVMSLADRAVRRRELRVPEAPTLAAAPDERGINRLRLARRGLGDPLRLLVPGLGEAFVLDPQGALLGRPEVGARVNYIVPRRPGPLITESEVEMYLDHPRLDSGDVNGDGRGDLLASTRHELRVFLQRPDGSFARAPDQRLPVGRLSRADHLRRSGSVRVQAADIDGDRRVDLLIASASGGVFDSRTDLGIHLNRNGSWNLATPDQQFRHTGAFATHELVDLDGDGRLELVVARVPTGLLDVVELLLTREIDAEVAIHRLAADGRFEPAPGQLRKVELKVSFEMLRTLGFVPTLDPDLNGDGRRDLVTSADGHALHIQLGREQGGFGPRDASQPLDTEGVIRFADLDGDGLDDFVLYDPRRPGEPIRVGRNLGRLPGTPRAQPAVRSWKRMGRRLMPPTLLDASRSTGPASSTRARRLDK